MGYVKRTCLKCKKPIEIYTYNNEVIKNSAKCEHVEKITLKEGKIVVKYFNPKQPCGNCKRLLTSKALKHVCPGKGLICSPCYRRMEGLYD